MAIGGQLIEGDVAVSSLGEAMTDVGADHFAGAPFEGIQRKSAGIGETIEHAQPSHIVHQCLAVFAVIEEQTGFLAYLGIHHKLQPGMLTDHQFMRWHLAPQHGASLGGGALFVAVFAAQHRHQIGIHRHQGSHHVVDDTRGAAAIALEHRHIAIQIDGDARQAVAFAKQPAVGGHPLGAQYRAPLPGLADALGNQGCVDAIGGGIDADGDGTLGIPQANPAPARTAHHHFGAIGQINGGIEVIAVDPRMATPQGIA